MRAVRWYVPPVLLSLCPLAIVVGANVGTVPLRGAVVARAVLFAAGAVVVMLWALRGVQRDLGARAAWLSWFLMLCNLYGASAQGLRQLNLQIWAPDPLFAIPYVVTSAVVAAIACRPWEVRPRQPLPLTIAAALLLAVAFLPAAAEGRQAHPSWRASADRLVTAALADAPAPAFVPTRDIYYIVLDGLGRADTMAKDYGVDLTDAVEALEARGFYVARDARSNYTQTYLSLASTLNLNYLDDLAVAVGPAAQDRDPLDYLIQENALMRIASRAGYRVVAIGSDFMGTQQIEQADVCICARSGLDEVEVAAIALTPLAALPLEADALDPYEAHRRKIIDGLAALEGYERGGRRTLVFAHVVAPHPPFVLARDGTPLRPPRRPYSLADWREFAGPREEYISGYGQQTQYVLDRVVTAVDAILRQPGPTPAIVIHGDHGPGARWRYDGPSESAVGERMQIFAAYLFPDGAADLYPAITPVNGARLLARRYLGADLPPLPDRVLFSTGDRPYDLMPVTQPQSAGH
ncbi:MAG: LTA synthase family protein [Acidimicrobiia bacterium]|nr:LTA synthase family protein [Acidimicrobiia bacterium]